jgi:hypothetical protein
VIASSFKLKLHIQFWYIGADSASNKNTRFHGSCSILRNLNFMLDSAGTFIFSTTSSLLTNAYILRCCLASSNKISTCISLEFTHRSTSILDLAFLGCSELKFQYSLKKQYSVHNSPNSGQILYVFHEMNIGEELTGLWTPFIISQCKLKPESTSDTRRIMLFLISNMINSSCSSHKKLNSSAITKWWEKK